MTMPETMMWRPRYVCLLIALGVAFFAMPDANADDSANSDLSSEPASTTTTADPASDEVDKDRKVTRDVEEMLPESGSLAYTSWDFQIDVVGYQHEPAGKNLDKFEATLRFAALLPHAKKNMIQPEWTGFGEITTSVVTRASQSFQAPHSAPKAFHVCSTCAWIGGSIQVSVAPEDAVTYSLTTGEVLGTTSVLKYMLADATGVGLDGTLAFFFLARHGRGARWAVKNLVLP